MPRVHKYPIVSFRVSPRQRELIEAKIKASGLMKKDYYIRSCINNSVCVVGKKEVIYELVTEVRNMQNNIVKLVEKIKDSEVTTNDEIDNMRNKCMDMLSSIIWMLEGASYLWK